MALSVDNIYQLALTIIKKNQAGNLTSIQFAYLWNAEQNAYMSDLLGRFQRVSNGKSGINTGLIENQTILTKLAPFTTSATLTVTSGNGTLPTDFIYELGIRVNGAEVRPITHSQIAAVNSSVIDPPSITNNSYYKTMYENYYMFLPSAVTSADLDYIRTPADVFWAFTYDGNNRQVYDAANSDQPEWDNLSCLEITKRMLKTLGVAFSSQDFEQYGASVQNTGN